MNDAQKKAVKQYQDLKQSKLFQNFVSNMKDLFDPEKNTYFIDGLNAQRRPEDSSKFFVLSPSEEERNAMSVNALLFKAKLITEKLGEAFPDKMEDIEGSEKEKDYLETAELPEALAKIKQEFDRRYAAFRKQYADDPEKAPLAEYRAFESGRAIFDEVGSIVTMDARTEKLTVSPELYQERALEESVLAEKQKLESAKEKYLTDQEKLRYELDALENNGRTYSFGKLTVDGTAFKALKIDKTWYRTNEDLFSEKDNYLDKIGKAIDDEIIKTNNYTLRQIHKEYEKATVKLENYDLRYDGEIANLYEDYKDNEKRYDELTALLGDEKPFDEYREYGEYNEAISEFEKIQFDTERPVDATYFRSFSEPGDQEAYFDREENDYEAELNKIDEEIRACREEIEKSQLRVDTAKASYESAKELNETNQKIDEVLEEKVEGIAQDIVELSQITQDISQARITKISDIPQNAFKTAKLGGLKETAEKQFLDYLSFQRPFTDDLHRNVNFDKITRDLTNIVTGNGKMPYFSDRNPVGLGLDEGYIRDLKNAATENNPKDPEKTDVIRRFGIIKEMLGDYEQRLGEAREESLARNEKARKAIEDEIRQRNEALQNSEQKYKDAEADYAAFDKKSKEDILNAKEAVKSVEGARKAELERIEADCTREIAEFKEYQMLAKLSKNSRKKPLEIEQINKMMEYADKYPDPKKTSEKEFTKNRIAQRDQAIIDTTDFYKTPVERAQKEAERLETTLRNALANQKEEVEFKRDNYQITKSGITEKLKELNTQLKENDKERAEINKGFDALHENVQKFRDGEYAKLSKNVDGALESIMSYLNSVSEVYAENEKLRQEKIAQKEAIPQLQKDFTDELAVNKRENLVSEEDLKNLENDIAEEEEYHQEQLNTLDYLQSLKNALEKGRVWHAQKEKQSHLEEKKELSWLKGRLDARDNQVAELRRTKIKAKDEAIRNRDEQVAYLRDWQKDSLELLDGKKATLAQAREDMHHVTRRMKALNESAKVMVAAKEMANSTVAAERMQLMDQYEKMTGEYAAREDALLQDVMNSKKKYGFDSDLFRNVKDAIIDYQALKVPNYDTKTPREERLAMERKRQQDIQAQRDKLMETLDRYIAERFDKSHPHKRTDRGQKRLDAVFALKTALNNHQRDMQAYNDKLQAINESVAKVNVAPKTQLEVKSLQADQELSRQFFDYDTMKNIADKTKKAEENFLKRPTMTEQELAANPVTEEESRLTPLTEEMKQSVARENETADIAEKAQEEKDLTQTAMDYYDKQLAEQVKFDEARAKKEREALIPEVEYSKNPYYKDWEENKARYPKEVQPAMEEFMKIMANVPTDYGFEKFNQGRNFFTRYSLEKYKEEGLAQKEFMKDNHLHDPKLTDEQLEAIKEFDTKMHGKVDYTFGHREYVTDFLLEHPDETPVWDLNKYIYDKFNLQGPMEQSVLKFKLDHRREVAHKLGIEDPTEKIPLYGQIFDEEGYYKEQIQEKLKEAKAAADTRDKVIKEITEYDKKLSKVKPDLGFKEYLKKHDPLTEADYVKMGMAKVNYAFDKKLVNPKTEYMKAHPEHKGDLPENVQQELKKYFDTLKNVSPTYGFSKAHKKAVEQERQAYIRSGFAQEAYLLKNPKLVDPRLKYDREIRNDLVLAQMYKPEIVKEVETQFINMGQLDEQSEYKDYEKNGLAVITNALKDQLSPQKEGLDNDGYYDGFEKYPKDLQDKIREYDRIMAAVPKDFGYAEFEKNVDVRGRFSKEEFVKNDFGRKYFAQMHRLVDPRTYVTKEQALDIREYDKMLGNPEEKTQQAYETYKKENAGKDILPYEDYVHQIYGDNNREMDIYNKKLNLEINGKTPDPRESIPNYGMIVLKQEDYAKVAQPLFDDSERLQRNEMIVKAVQEYIEKVKNVPDDYGFKPYDPKSGDRLIDYESRKEFMASGRAKALYAIDNKIDDPFRTYFGDIDKDPQLRDQIREVGKDYFKAEKDKRAQYKAMEEDDPLVQKRDEERKKEQKILDTQKNEVNELVKETYLYSLSAARSRQIYREKREEALAKGYSVELYDQMIEKESNKILLSNESIKKMRDSDRANARIDELRKKMYCDSMTIASIEKEEAALKEFDEQLNGKDVFLVGWREGRKATDGDMSFFGARQERLNELKQLRDKVMDLCHGDKKAYEEMLKDQVKLDRMMEQIRAANGKQNNVNQPESPDKGLEMERQKFEQEQAARENSDDALSNNHDGPEADAQPQNEQNGGPVMGL